MTNIKQKLFNALMGIISILTIVGCGTKVGTGAVSVEFTNNTTGTQSAEYEAVGIRGILGSISLQTSTLLGITPTIYQMKLVAFYMVENQDAEGNNQGAGTHIWVNKNCDSDLTYCGINPSIANGYLADYFDFARTSSIVNTDFNSYKRDTKDSQVGLGTYRYIKMDFSGKVFSDSDTTANLKFGTTTANEVRAQNYALTVKLAEPLVIAEGDTFTVNLAYSLDNRYYASGTYNQAPSEVGSDQKWTCNGKTSNIPCIVEAVFAPTITKK